MKEKLLVLLAGQSNMAGRGYLTEEDVVEIPQLTALRRDFQWIPAIDPFNYDRLNMLGLSNAADPFEVRGIELAGNRRCGVGPGRTFGKLLLERFPDCEVGLIPAAVGGTPVASWMPGGADVDPNSGFFPYDDAIKLTREAMKTGRLVAILWHQGETDAFQETPNYKEKLHTIIANFRRDLDAPEVPFILGGLGEFSGRENFPAYDRMIREVAAEGYKTGFASAAGLKDRGDDLHFDTPGQYELGRRYWKEFCRFIED